MFRLPLAVSLILSLGALAPAQAQTENRDAGSVRFETGFPVPPASVWPVDAPAIRFYFGAGASAPSCGLLVARRKLIVPLVEPDEGTDFPQCIGVPSALVLQQGAERYLLLRVRQKDTREDSSVSDMLLLDGNDLPVQRDDLSATSAPSSTKPLSQVAAWLRARWVNQTDAQQGARPLPEHTATTPGAYLALAQLSGGQCQFSLGTPDRSAPALKLTKPCERVVATSTFQQGAVSWFVVLLEAGGQGAQALVFEADAKGAREVPELASELKAKAAEGKILPLRQALQRLVAARR